MNGKKVGIMQSTLEVSVDSNKLKREFKKMSENAKRVVDRILKQKIEPEEKSNGKKVAK
jgi:hypothetical protein